MDSVNKGQEEAIHHIDGPMMVLAGPGSGKTYTITKRLEYMIKCCRINPGTILVITFTKASALEMEERFNKLMVEEYCPVVFGTFHAIYFHILQEYYHYDFGNIITEREKREYLKAAILSVRDEADDGLIEGLLSDFSKMKNDGTSIFDTKVQYIDNEDLVSIYEKYDGYLKENSKIDFEDMVVKCKNLLQENETVLANWRERYRYILIDEFQDINQMQYDVIKMLAYPSNNLFVVGDDDQSIYGFRGSKPEIMLSFNQEFNNVKTVFLSKNYRSTQSIVDCASSFVAHNEKRYKKCLEAVKVNGTPIAINGFSSADEENTYIINLIKTLIRKCDYKDIAIIFRTNSLARNLSLVLSNNKIPFQFKDKPVSILNSACVKDILAMLSFAYGQCTRENALRFINKPSRYIRREWLDANADFNKLLNNSEIPSYVKKNISILKNDLEFVSRLNPFAAINYILKKMGYISYLKKKCSTDDKYTDELGKIELLQKLATDAIDGYELQKKLQDYDNELTKCEEDNPNRIQIVTMHGSKGLEYENVLLPSVNEGNIPSKKSFTKEQIEEERRVFYVAMTRAKERLFISFVKNDKERKRPSRFIKEIDIGGEE